MVREIYGAMIASRNISRVLSMLLLLASTTVVIAGPIVALPINSQVPPVARVSKPFLFTFCDSTFVGGSGKVEYTIENSPAWLSLDSLSRTFSGTPDTTDVSSIDFSLLATDGTGSTSMPVTFVVSAKQGPSLGLSVGEQLPAFGTFSGPDALLIYPSSALSITFDMDTFRNTNTNTLYYATCANNTPLPSWITFDSSTLSLTGVAPLFDSPMELPQDFGIRLIGSDVPGYAAAIATFHLIVSRHELTFGPMNTSITALPGKEINYDGLLDALLLDGIRPQSSAIRVTMTGNPAWLAIDTKSLSLFGTAPPTVTDATIIITAADQYGDSANTTLSISGGAPADINLGQIGPMHATIGEEFKYQLNYNDITTGNVTISVDLLDASSWLSFNPTSLTFSGRVPEHVLPQTEELNLTATLGSRSQSRTIGLVIAKQGPNDVGGTSASSATLFPPGSMPTTQSQSGSNKNRNPNKYRIVAAVLIPIFAIMALLLLATSIRRRRRHQGKSAFRFSKIGSPCIAWIRKLRVDKPIHRENQMNMRECLDDRSFQEPATIRQKRCSSPPRIDAVPFMASIHTRPTTTRNSQQRFSTQDGLFKEMKQRYSWLGATIPDSSAQAQFSIEKPARILSQDLATRSASRLQKMHQGAMKTKGLTRSQRLTGFGHGSGSPPFSCPSNIPSRTILQFHPNRQHRLRQASSQFKTYSHSWERVQPTHRNTSHGSRSTAEWSTTNETTEGTISSASNPNLVPLPLKTHSQENGGSVAEGNKATIRVVPRSPSVPERSRDRIISNILRERRKRDSTFFSSSLSSRKSSRRTERASKIGDTGSVQSTTTATARASNLSGGRVNTFSTFYSSRPGTSSARRKGRMMQGHVSKPQSKFEKQLVQQARGHGRPPLFAGFSSTNSFSSVPDGETTSGSNYGSDLGMEDLVEERKDEKEGFRRWAVASQQMGSSQKLNELLSMVRKQGSEENARYGKAGMRPVSVAVSGKEEREVERKKSMKGSIDGTNVAFI